MTFQVFRFDAVNFV